MEAAKLCSVFSTLWDSNSSYGQDFVSFYDLNRSDFFFLSCMCVQHMCLLSMEDISSSGSAAIDICEPSCESQGANLRPSEEQQAFLTGELSLQSPTYSCMFKKQSSVLSGQ